MPNAYFASAWMNHRALCECSWSGKRRWIRGSAELDAFHHHKDSGHTLVGLSRVFSDALRGAA